MAENHLHCVIYVDATITIHPFRFYLADLLATPPSGSGKLVTETYLVAATLNAVFGRRRSSTQEDEYQSYRIRIDIDPAPGAVYNDYVQAVSELLSSLWEEGWPAVAICSFAAELPRNGRHYRSSVGGKRSLWRRGPFRLAAVVSVVLVVIILALTIPWQSSSSTGDAGIGVITDCESSPKVTVTVSPVSPLINRDLPVLFSLEAPKEHPISWAGDCTHATIMFPGVLEEVTVAPPMGSESTRPLPKITVSESKSQGFDVVFTVIALDLATGNPPPPWKLSGTWKNGLARIGAIQRGFRFGSNQSYFDHISQITIQALLPQGWQTTQVFPSEERDFVSGRPLYKTTLDETTGFELIMDSPWLVRVRELILILASALLGVASAVAVQEWINSLPAEQPTR